MKLLIITAITAFNEDVIKMLKKTDVKTFSSMEVNGHKNMAEEAIENNWFASEIIETESTLFYAFAKVEKVDVFFDLVTQFNNKQETASKIHIAVLNIEKSNS